MPITRRSQYYFHKQRFHKRLLYLALSIAIVLGAVLLLFTGTHPSGSVLGSIASVFQRISPWTLLLYGLYTVLRLLISYIIVVILTVLILVVLLSNKALENFLLPIFDVLQSVPVLAFFPLIIIVFANLHLPELAAQIVLVVSMLWPLVFAGIGAMNQIPMDIIDASRIYGGKGWKKFTKVIFPAIFPELVTGSELSLGNGWSVIIISEYINYGNVQIHLPGLGSLLSSNAAADPGIFVASLLLMIIIITINNRVVWHRLTLYSEKFKFEE
jgi:NitT/TauT family transport system permease protein